MFSLLVLSSENEILVTIQPVKAASTSVKPRGYNLIDRTNNHIIFQHGSFKDDQDEREIINFNIFDQVR